MRSEEGNSCDSTENRDAKNLQERRQGVLVLLTNLNKLADKICLPCSVSPNSSLV